MKICSVPWRLRLKIRQRRNSSRTKIEEAIVITHGKRGLEKTA